jgi:hypothetical protein
VKIMIMSTSSKGNNWTCHASDLMFMAIIKLVYCSPPNLTENRFNIQA